MSDFSGSWRLQLLAAERVLLRAELHLEQPRLAGDGVKEPAVALLRRGDLDHAAVVPVGLAELARLVDAIDDARQYLAIPANRLSLASHAVPGVPASPVGLPRHLRLAAHVADVETPGLRGGGLLRIERHPLLVRPRGEDRGEGEGGVGFERGGGGEGGRGSSRFLSAPPLPAQRQ